MVLANLTNDQESTSKDPSSFDEKHFERQLHVFRKHATHTITLANCFYICSLYKEVIVYEGQLSPGQAYDYFHNLNPILFDLGIAHNPCNGLLTKVIWECTFCLKKTLKNRLTKLKRIQVNGKQKVNQIPKVEILEILKPRIISSSKAMLTIQQKPTYSMIHSIQ